MTSEMLSENVDRIGDISTKIREAIRKALLAGPEQFMTVMVPGKVVNYGRLYFTTIDFFY